jgi:putative SOS response-associated peptidase YedK
MCGRYVLSGEPSTYAEFLSVDRIVAESVERSYNVAPTDPVLSVAEWKDERLLGEMRWGFVPFWAKDAKGMQINARSETVATKPMFRDSFSRKRCILPADGFYEWEPKEAGRTPHWVFRADGYPMAFAGIWSTWKDPSTGELVRTCAIITTKAEGSIGKIHARMPVILDPSVWDAWLDRDLTDASEAERLLQPVPSDLLMERAVSTRVNNVRNDGPELIEPATEDG